jgi:hypothetical protein
VIGVVVGCAGAACASGDDSDRPGGLGLSTSRTGTDGETEAGADGDGATSAADSQGTGDGGAEGEEPTGDGTGSGDPTDSGDDAETGDTPSVCEIEGDEVWRRHAFRLTTQTWDAPQPLDAVWVGAAAPPPRGIVAAATAAHSQRLFIITEAGCLHERIGAQWVEMPLSQRFAETAGSSTKSATGAKWPSHDELTLVDNPTARVYELSTQGDVVGEPLIVTMSDDPMGAPQGTGTALWGFTVTRPELMDIEPWFDAYSFYDDGFFYWMNAGTGSAPGAGWSTHPASGGSNPIFAGSSPNEPDPHQLRAAYYSASADRVYFIGP